MFNINIKKRTNTVGTLNYDETSIEKSDINN